MKLFVVLVSVFMACVCPTLALDSLSQEFRNYAWVDVGAGAIASSSISGISIAASASHLSSVGLLTLRFVGGGPAGNAGAAVFASNDEEYVEEIGALYGRALRTDFLFASASIGLGAVWGNDHHGNPYNRFTTIGLPMEIDAFIHFFPVVGIGGKYVVDLNNRSNFSSILLCLRIGMLRYVKHPS